jgi:hypothetical protein
VGFAFVGLAVGVAVGVGVGLPIVDGDAVALGVGGVVGVGSGSAVGWPPQAETSSSAGSHLRMGRRYVGGVRVAG